MKKKECKTLFNNAVHVPPGNNLVVTSPVAPFLPGFVGFNPFAFYSPNHHHHNHHHHKHPDQDPPGHTHYHR